METLVIIKFKGIVNIILKEKFTEKIEKIIILFKYIKK